ncbi:hypothetical protein POI8812_01404 [Pontivivens insulae]|uniref:Phytase-like domain-containing protein n=2 Tax=Pontivivens insulae TaxID=1639689 RepID=A0A2R8AAI8_9RHOB|nr:hypothetical protein DFR53_2141 [Pontivivens insulae]SPF29098.1 hypothetical protein POI8812_01404 [Pontivivens insulae]
MLCMVPLSSVHAQQSGTEAQLLSQFAWSEPVEGWGGFSAIAIGEDGQQITLISDRGTYVQGTVQRDAQGEIFDVELTTQGALRASTGDVPTNLRFIDAEGIAVRPDGRIAVSFERTHRVMLFDRLDGVPNHLNRDPFRALQNNSGLEALAVDLEGRLLAIPERSGTLERPFPVWRLEGTEWVHRFDVPRLPPYLVSGAEVGPDGRLYILERHFTGFSFGTRVRSFAMGNGLSDERLVIPAQFGLADNAEGIDLWRDGDGRLRLILIADDNFNFFQRSLISEFVLD